MDEQDNEQNQDIGLSLRTLIRGLTQNNRAEMYQRLIPHRVMRSGELHFRRGSLDPHLAKTFVFLSMTAKFMPVALGVFSPWTPKPGIYCGKMNSKDWAIMM